MTKLGERQVITIFFYRPYRPTAHWREGEEREIKKKKKGHGLVIYRRERGSILIEGSGNVDLSGPSKPEMNLDRSSENGEDPSRRMVGTGSHVGRVGKPNPDDPQVSRARHTCRFCNFGSSFPAFSSGICAVQRRYRLSECSGGAAAGGHQLTPHVTTFTV